MTSGLSGSPAATTSRSGSRPRHAVRSCWTSIRQTVGGAQNDVTPTRSRVASRPAASNRGWLTTVTVASAFQGAKRLLQACLAHPGEDTLTCTSPGCRPIQYMVDRCPIGYEACVCSTSLGEAVVPEVK